MSDNDTPKEKNEGIESESKERKSRRDILRGLAASSVVVAGQEVLPDQWAKPLLDTVVLPSHARTSKLTNKPDDDSGSPDGDTDREIADDFRDEGVDDTESDPVDGTDDVGPGFDSEDGTDDSGLADGPGTDAP